MNKQTGLAALTFGALGVVFGDIGTSPIYAMKTSLSTAGNEVYDIYGVASLIFWSLMIVVSLKYLIFILRADNKGEGGILALFSLLPKSIRKGKTKSGFSIFFLMLIGTALLLGDGVLTPAISVLSATEGLGALNPDLAHLSVPLTVVILAVLFSVQFKGTASLGKPFGFIVLLWFLNLAVLGVIQMSKNPEVIQALSPYYAFDYVVHHGFHTLIIMSSVILAVTGAEALYADLGHFGKRAIRVGWIFIVGPALVLNYLGQASLMLEDRSNLENLFFNLAPNKTWAIANVILATGATIIASQALITGVGSIARQAVQLGIFPRLKVVHTNAVHEGQIYVPVVNALVGIGSIALVINLKTSAALADAYSFAIAGTMLITTIAFAIVAIDRWKWSKPYALGLAFLFGIFDLSFFLATVTKLFKGAWIPVAISAFLVYLMMVWRKGQNLLAAALLKDTTEWEEIDRLIKVNKVERTNTVGIYLSSTADKVPQAVMSQLRNLHSIPERIYIVTVITEDTPTSTTPPEVKLIRKDVTQIVIHTGFMESPNVPELLKKCCLDAEIEKSATYYLSDRNFVSPEAGELRGAADKVFSFLHRNSSTASHYYGLPEDRVITLAVQMNL
jgi:KUP system potassium uptake protein